MNLTHFIIFVLALAVFYLAGIGLKNYLTNKKLWKKANIGTVEGSLLALFAFFLGFTFSISASKLETIRQSSVQESNDIGTAFLRTSLYPDSVQNEYKKLFTDYVGSRVDYFKPKLEKDEYHELYNTSLDKSNKIWEYTASLEKSKNFLEESRLMIPAVNDMIDIITTRNSDINSSLPPSIINTLIVLSFCSCFIVGFSVSSKSISHIIGIIYIFMVALTVNLIIDANDPRSGFINTDRANQNIVDVYEQIKK